MLSITAVKSFIVQALEKTLTTRCTKLFAGSHFQPCLLVVSKAGALP